MKLVLGVIVATGALLGLAHPSGSQPQQPANAQKTGEITGVSAYCGTAGNASVTVYIPGESSQARTSASGKFRLRFVPAGTYQLVFDIPGQPSHHMTVTVASNTISDLGTVVICRDTDNDGHPENVDCNDNNPTIHPGAAEACDGFDNNCDGQVDEGCPTCTDTDNDGFHAQFGCGTDVDCDDEDAQIRPNAPEHCDGVDNNCNEVIDDGFDLNSDLANCGTCGNVCSVPNAEASCVGGVCQMGTCLNGFLDCDGVPSNGCEHFGASCGAGCTPECQAGYYCLAGTCQPTKQNGSPCAESGECQSAYCVDSVCCSQSCAGLCLRCNLPGSAGDCTAIPAGQDPDNECAGEAVCAAGGSCEPFTPPGW